MNEAIYRQRISIFQEKMREKNIDLSIIRTLSSYIYFTGTKWLRPSLLIPATGEPFVMIGLNEGKYFEKRSWIRNYIEYNRIERLMFKIMEYIRKNNVQRLGMENSVERDSFVFFQNMFKTLNPKVELVDVLQDIMSLRVVKEPIELENIREAGKIAGKAHKFAEEIIMPGMDETEIAGELLRFLYKNGCEEPKVYVSAYPRLHAEPLHGFKIEKNRFYSVVIGADYNNYFANKSNSIYIGKPQGKIKDAIEAKEKAYQVALSKTKPGASLLDIEKAIENTYKEYGLGDYYITGYTHGVGLLIEELPMTTIITMTRKMPILANMVMAFVHAPLMMPEGAVRREETVIIGENGPEVVT